MDGKDQEHNVTTKPIRLSPSGPIIGSGDSGSGARLRLAEAISTIGGTTLIPSADSDTAILSVDGFPDPSPFDPITVSLDDPSPELKYRAFCELDVRNDTTGVLGEVVIYLDLSLDGEASWWPITKTGHKVSSETDGRPGVRPVTGWIPIQLGSLLHVADGSPSITLRARVLQPTSALCYVDSDPSTGVSGVQGTIHMVLEECEA